MAEYRTVFLCVAGPLGAGIRPEVMRAGESCARARLAPARVPGSPRSIRPSVRRLTQSGHALPPAGTRRATLEAHAILVAAGNRRRWPVSKSELDPADARPDPRRVRAARRRRAGQPARRVSHAQRSRRAFGVARSSPRSRSRSAVTPRGRPCRRRTPSRRARRLRADEGRRLGLAFRPEVFDIVVTPAPYVEAAPCRPRRGARPHPASRRRSPREAAALG